MIALIDGDIFTRRYTAAAQYTMFDMSDGEEVRTHSAAKKYIEDNPGVTIIDSTPNTSPIEYVMHSIKLAMMDIMNFTGADTLHMYLGEKGGKNFRHDLFPEYKGNRKDKEKPVHYEAIYNWLLEKYDATICHGIEADDALGIATSRYSDWVICSNDKDMLQIPGKHYNFIKKEALHISQLGGDKRLFQQILMGDSTDNIQGLPRVGEATSKKMIWPCVSFQQMYDVTVAAYKKQYGEDWYNEFMLAGSLVYLLRKQGDSFHDYLVRNGIDLEKHVA